MKFRDYKPYNNNEIRIKSLSSDIINRKEIMLMDRVYANMLENFSVEEFKKYRGNSLEKGYRKIKLALECSEIGLYGKILEFGAGTCKTAALISKISEVKNIHCLDGSKVLMKEIGPRVIGMFGGNVRKVKFLIGDMNDLDDLDDDYDFAICYGAVHHLIIPEHFFSQLHIKLKSKGKVICLGEPALPGLYIPTKQIRTYLNGHYGKRFDGQNENIYTLKQYKRMAGKLFHFKNINLRIPNKFHSLLLNHIYPCFGLRTYYANFVLEKQ